MAKAARAKKVAQKSSQSLVLKIEVDTSDAKAAIEQLKAMVTSLRADIASIAVDAVRKAKMRRAL